MTPPLTYLEFVAAFVAAPVALLLAVRPGVARERRRTAIVGVAIMLTLALAYTTPWDNYLIAEGVWWYGSGTVLIRGWNAPLGEYLFIALQTLLAALWLYRRPLPLPAPGSGDPAATSDSPDPEGAVADGGEPVGAGVSTGDRGSTAPAGDAGTGRRTSRLPSLSVSVLGGSVGLAITALGVLGLSGATYYLGAILAWAGPVLALQWVVGAGYLLSVRRYLLWTVAPPVVYLCAVDRLAIGLGLWTISADHTTGLTVAGLPVEEATFFLVTTTMVVQGLVLFHWVVETRPYRTAFGS